MYSPINPASLLSRVLIDYDGLIRKKLVAKSYPWGWLENILRNKGKDFSYVDEMFKIWNFPRSYEEEMAIFKKMSTEAEIKEYITLFFMKRAEKMAMGIRDKFFGVDDMKWQMMS